MFRFEGIHIEDQLPPEHAWGRRHFVVPAGDLEPTTDVEDVIVSNLLRIVAAVPGTTVTLSPSQEGVSEVVLDPARPAEVLVTSPCEVVGSGPILVGQLMTQPTRIVNERTGEYAVVPEMSGGPALATVPPVAQFRSDYVLALPALFDQALGGGQTNGSFVSVVRLTGEPVRLDDALVETDWTPVGATHEAAVLPDAGTSTPEDAAVAPVDAGADGGSTGDDGGAGDAGVDGGPREPQPATLDEYQQRLAALLCERSLACHSKGGSDGALLQLLCDPDLRERALAEDDPALRRALFGSGLFAPGNAELVPDQAAACLDDLRAKGCDLGTGPPPTSCSRAYQGGLLMTGTVQYCVGDAECRGRHCGRESPTCAGHCIVNSFLGESCLGTSDVLTSGIVECAPWLVCRGGTCQSPGRREAVCEGNADCAAGFWCEPEGQRCQERPTLDEPCARDPGEADPCLGEFVCSQEVVGTRCTEGIGLGNACTPERPCGPGLACSLAGRCAQLVRPGDPCGEDAKCPFGFACPVEGAAPRCRRQPLPGESCGDEEPPCLVGRCGADGICSLLPPGASCDPLASRGLQACEGLCGADGVCRDRVPRGGPCEDSADCGDGLLCRGDTRTCDNCVFP